jgi:cytochrome c
MRRATQTLIHAVVTAALSLSVSSVLAQDTNRAERQGESLLSQHCSMCHAIRRSGGSPNREAPPFRTLSKRFPIESLSEALGKGRFTGHPNMPEFAFSPRDVGAILSYLQSIQQP